MIEVGGLSQGWMELREKDDWTWRRNGCAICQRGRNGTYIWQDICFFFLS